MGILFRKGLGINTNMYLESFHKVLKLIYLEGKKCKRVDKCIFALMKLTRDKMFSRLQKNVKGKNSYRVELINQRHIKSKSLNNHISQTPEDSWLVNSETNSAVQYIVLKEKDILCDIEKCQLICKECKVCAHIFSCTCMDYFVKLNPCKQIHAVV